MVFVGKENAYQLRDYLLQRVLSASAEDAFKSCLAYHFELAEEVGPVIQFSALSLYQKCIVCGLNVIDESVSTSDLARLFGQSPKIESTPMPWVSDIMGILAIRWLVSRVNDKNLTEHFTSWILGFLPEQAMSERMSVLERDIANFVLNDEGVEFQSATVPLFLHYHGDRMITEQSARQALFDNLMKEFRQQSSPDLPTVILAMMVYCFDRINEDLALFPSNGWSLEDFLHFLERIPVGLKRWTWESSGRTRGSQPVTWPIENEYHVQNLLYVLLAPIFSDVADEIYLQQVGQKTPRADLYLPSLHTIVEVKFRKDSRKSFQKLISEIAEDVSLYHADSKYENARIVCFLWDHTRSTQEHAKFKEGVLKIQGADGCVVLSSPSIIQ